MRNKLVAAIGSLISLAAFASVSVTMNGTSYTIPQTGEKGWGTQVTTWIQGASTGTLQKTGGNFTLTADANFGATYGLKGAYFSTRTANPSTAGLFRLANTESIGWRNAANSADLLLTTNASNLLTFNGSVVPTLSTTGTSGGIPYFSATNVVSSSALLTANALILGGGAGASPTSLGSLGTTTTVLHGNASGAPTYGAVGLTTDVSGALPLVNGGTGTAAASANAAFNALSPLTTKGDLAGYSTTNARVPVGADGTVLSADSSQTTGLKYISVLSNPMTTLGDIIYENASPAAARLAVGTNGQALTVAAGIPTWTGFTAPTTQTLTSTSSSTYTMSRKFFVTSASATAGATYTNNSVTWTVSATIASGTELVMTGNGDPTTSGTLTKASGTGDATITFSRYLKPVYLKVTGVGGGGGGGPSGTASFGTAGTGSTTTFGSSLLSATGGVGGGPGTAGTGGTATITAPAYGLALTGNAGGYGSGGTALSFIPGGVGHGAPFFASGGVAGGQNGAGSAAQGPGAGGGGAGGGASASSGGGGGSGGGFQAVIPSPSNTYTYQCGALGAGATLGTSGAAGGNGANGQILVEEHYQ